MTDDLSPDHLRAYAKTMPPVSFWRKVGGALRHPIRFWRFRGRLRLASCEWRTEPATDCLKRAVYRYRGKGLCLEHLTLFRQVAP